MNIQLAEKSPGLAALLNALPIPLGFGYYYLGLKRRFVFALIVGCFTTALGVILGLLVTAIFAFRHAFGGGEPPELWRLIAFGIGAIPVLLVAAVSAWDAWRLAERR
ncbi:MAG: hypothetical protein L0177_11885 [Chloroflexi bacterium]|nr:hypothetical protein [Chloroflexota bacterium]